MRLLRTLAPLALIGALATACGSGSSSSASTTPGDGSTPPSTTSGASSSSDQLQVRPVAARHSPGVQFGPQIPKELEAQLAKQPCPMKPVTFQAMLMECDAAKTVYLMKDPLTSGGVDQAVAKQIGSGKLWYVQATLDPSTASTLAAGVSSLTGTDVAYSFDGTVLTSVVVDSSFDSNKLTITGDYDKAQATRLASQLAAS